jgi:hypothetical protein
MVLWHFAENGRPAGPVEFAALREMAATGRLKAGDLVWSEGMADWIAASHVPGLVMTAAIPPVSAPAKPLPYDASVQPALAYQTPTATPSPHANLALTAMILSLVSLVIGGPCLGTAGLICGWIALKGMKRSNDFHNKGFAVTGVVIGAIWLGLVLIGGTILIAFLSFGFFYAHG